ncbi:hypothetical protein [Nocardia otitidiscaviarum]|uniref:hypothetical protein n=1 Tax=Nocardia otitidiscaviarum TaxID=1823 RepID=UPI0004A77DC6|nr:hypothetical protein [Nocardia otitidiscaviarum]
MAEVQWLTLTEIHRGVEVTVKAPRSAAEAALGSTLLRALETHLGMPRDLKASTDLLAALLREVVVSAGWRPPARVISDPAELDALPIESVVIDADGDAWQRYFTYWWLAGADTKRDSQGLVELCKRLTVVHIPPTRKESTDGQ